MLRRHLRSTFAHSIHFVTTTVALRGNWFVEPELCNRALDTLEKYRKYYELLRTGYCLMPDHIHILFHQQREGRNVSDFMERFKSFTARSCVPNNYPPEQKFWRRRFDSVPVPGTNAVRTKLKYMHANPVRKGIVESPDQYEWSSARAWHTGTQIGPVEVWLEAISS